MTTSRSKWTCDVCRVATFSTYEEAYQHEQVCKGVPPPPSSQPQEPPPPQTITIVRQHPQQQPHHPANHHDRPPSSSSSITTPVGNTIYAPPPTGTETQHHHPPMEHHHHQLHHHPHHPHHSSSTNHPHMVHHVVHHGQPPPPPQHHHAQGEIVTMYTQHPTQHHELHHQPPQHHYASTAAPPIYPPPPPHPSTVDYPHSHHHLVVPYPPPPHQPPHYPSPHDHGIQNSTQHQQQEEHQKNSSRTSSSRSKHNDKNNSRKRTIHLGDRDRSERREKKRKNHDQSSSSLHSSSSPAGQKVGDKNKNKISRTSALSHDEINKKQVLERGGAGGVRRSPASAKGKIYPEQEEGDAVDSRNSIRSANGVSSSSGSRRRGEEIRARRTSSHHSRGDPSCSSSRGEKNKKYLRTSSSSLSSRRSIIPQSSSNGGGSSSQHSLQPHKLLSIGDEEGTRRERDKRKTAAAASRLSSDSLHLQQNRHKKQPRQAREVRHNDRNRQHLRSGREEVTMMTKQHSSRNNDLVMKNTSTTSTSTGRSSSSKNGAVIVKNGALVIHKVKKSTSSPSKSFASSQKILEGSKRQMITTTKKVYVCDVCRRAYFDTYKEAEDHEKQCRGIPPLPPNKKNDTSIIGKDTTASCGGNTMIDKNVIMLSSPASSPIRSKKETLPLPMIMIDKKKNADDDMTLDKEKKIVTDKNDEGDDEVMIVIEKGDLLLTREKIQQDGNGEIETKLAQQAASQDGDMDADGYNNAAGAVGMQQKDGEDDIEEDSASILKNDEKILLDELSSQIHESTIQEEHYQSRSHVVQDQRKEDGNARDEIVTIVENHDAEESGVEAVGKDSDDPSDNEGTKGEGNSSEILPASEENNENAEIVTVDHLITAELSPFLRNDGDSPDFFKLSSFNARLLSSIDLFEIQMPSMKSVEGGKDHNVQEPIISFRCTHCREMLSPEPHNFFVYWTRDLVKSNLCTVIYDHLNSTCEEIPVKEMQRMQASLPHKDSGKISFGDFIGKYFDENGIVDDINSPAYKKTKEEKNAVDGDVKASKMVLLKTPEWVTPNYSCRRRSDALGISERNNDQTSGYKIFPLSGIKKLEKVEKSLSPMNKITINQLTFLVQESRKSVVDCKSFYHVAIRCKHCGTSTYLNSLGNWYKFVYNKANSHLTKSCNSITKELREQIIALQGKRKFIKQPKMTGLKQYCDMITKQYKFIEKDSSYGTRVCVPCIPDISENVKSAIIKNRKLREGTESPTQKEDVSPTNSKQSKSKIDITENNSTQKTNTLDRLVDDKYEEQRVRLAENALKEGIMIENEDGNVTYLVPPTGVPLICSFTFRMAAELNAHNRLLLNQLELVEDHSANTTFGSPPLLLRCQNCNSNPAKIFTKTLTTVDDFHKIVVKLREHLETCTCTPKAIRDEVTRTKTTNNIGCMTLKDYCRFLKDAYGMIDTKRTDGKTDAVAWDTTCKYTLIEGVWGPRTLIEIAKVDTE